MERSNDLTRRGAWVCGLRTRQLKDKTHEIPSGDDDGDYNSSFFSAFSPILSPTLYPPHLFLLLLFVWYHASFLVPKFTLDTPQWFIITYETQKL